MRDQTKAYLFIGVAIALLLLGLYLANQAYFTAWRTAFTHANVPLLKKWFYVFCLAGAASFIASAVFLIGGVKKLKALKRK